MIISNNKLNNFQKIDTSDVYFLADFDGTITEDGGDTSWASIFRNNLVKKDFVNECTEIYKKYHVYEIDDKMPLNEKIKHMDEWYIQNIKILIKHKITREIIEYSSESKNIKLRSGALEFLKFLYQKKNTYYNYLGRSR